MRFSKQKSGRRGFTLIEMVYVVAAECAVVSLGIVALFLITEVRHKENRDDSARETASKLAEQFRDDFRTARFDEIEENRLRLTSPGGETIGYVIHVHEQPKRSFIERTLSSDGRQVARETFFLPSHSSARFERGKGEYADFCGLSIWTSPTDRRDRVIVAMPEKERLDPFTRQCSTASAEIDFDPCPAANWRTICVKIRAPQPSPE